MRYLLPALLMAFSMGVAGEGSVATEPHLLLTPKLLHRLRLEHDRATTRWVAFEKRVLNVPDSPQRGFELALYYAVTKDSGVAQQAKAWGLVHPCEYRQLAVIRDWIGALSTSCSSPKTLRDQVFEMVAAGQDVAPMFEKFRSEAVPALVSQGIPPAADFYALIELIAVLRQATGEDPRRAAPEFFRELPGEFLLSLTPAAVARPDWMAHIAALALIALDPNLESAQFLQGWVMEENQTLREGEGVAYELLWADPYLPGIAYQNRETWMYDSAGGRLFARTDWTPTACWITLSRNGLEELNCPAAWQREATHFGSLTLTPMPSKCLDLPRREAKNALVIWKLTPNEVIAYSSETEDKHKREIMTHADPAGLWLPGVNIEGKACRR